MVGLYHKLIIDINSDTELDTFYEEDCVYGCAYLEVYMCVFFIIFKEFKSKKKEVINEL